MPVMMKAESGEHYVRLACATEPEPPVFPAQIEDERWWGHVRPWFRREIAEAVIAWRATRSEPCTDWCDCSQVTVTLAGGTVTLTDSNTISGPVEPDEQGRYGIGASWWHWELTTPPTDPDTDAAILAEQARFVPQDGEQLVTIDIDGTDPAFPALLADTTWNGWACPSFRRPVAEAVIAWLNTTARKLPRRLPARLLGRRHRRLPGSQQHRRRRLPARPLRTRPRRPLRHRLLVLDLADHRTLSPPVQQGFPVAAHDASTPSTPHT